MSPQRTLTQRENSVPLKPSFSWTSISVQSMSGTFVATFPHIILISKRLWITFTRVENPLLRLIKPLLDAVSHTINSIKILTDRICSKFSSSKPRSNNSDGHEDTCTVMGPVVGFSQQFEPTQHGLPVGNFGLSITAKISVDASFAGPIIGKNSISSKQICRQTGLRLSIKDHETDPNMRNIELEGSFDQIKEASSMVHELIMTISAASGHVVQNMGSLGQSRPQSSYQKKKMCEKFSKGLCTFREMCRFAHS